MEKNILPILKDTNKIWQPSDFLPDPASPDFVDEVRELYQLSSPPACLLLVSRPVPGHSIQQLHASSDAVAAKHHVQSLLPLATSR